MPSNFNDGDLGIDVLDPFDQTERKVPRVAPTAQDLGFEPKPAVRIDRRVRSTAGDFRVVAPDGTQKGSKFYVNNSPMVIEKRGKDAMGAEKWDRITSYPKPSLKSGETEVDFALYWLFAGPDAE